MKRARLRRRRRRHRIAAHGVYFQYFTRRSSRLNCVREAIDITRIIRAETALRVKSLKRCLERREKSA